MNVLTFFYHSATFWWMTLVTPWSRISVWPKSLKNFLTPCNLQHHSLLVRYGNDPWYSDWPSNHSILLEHRLGGWLLNWYLHWLRMITHLLLQLLVMCIPLLVYVWRWFTTSYHGFGDLPYLKIATGQVPFPNRKNDHAVTVDIMRGIRPSRGASCHIECHNEETFWEMLDQCWDPVFHLRPSMSEVTTYLQGQMESPAVSQKQWFMHNLTQPALKYWLYFLFSTFVHVSRSDENLLDTLYAHTQWNIAGPLLCSKSICNVIITHSWSLSSKSQSHSFFVLPQIFVFRNIWIVLLFSFTDLSDCLVPIQKNIVSPIIFQCYFIHGLC